MRTANEHHSSEQQRRHALGGAHDKAESEQQARHKSAKTRAKVSKMYARLVRKLCDGQWVSERRKVAGNCEITCAACAKL